MTDREFNAYVIACVGLVFSLAWFLTNRGSKFWQENWEYHVDMLEGQVTGPLYRTVLHRPTQKNFLSRYVEGPAPYSVSQMNQWVSLFTIAVWFSLIVINVLPTIDIDCQISFKYAFIGAITAAAVLLMLRRTKSNIVEGKKHAVFVKRTTVIDG